MIAENIVSGRVLDSSTRQPIEFANVSLSLQNDATPLTGGVTDIDGEFLLHGVPNGSYTLTVSFMGYIDQKKEIMLSGSEVKVGRILLVEDTQHLQEVEIVGQGATMRFELDKKIFTVDQNIANAGASVSEALENIPSVEVDQEGNISLRNNDAVEIWINGKPAGLTAENRAQVLQQMPADAIKEIELITNPSAKFSPEGTAGIINLVMKKDRKAGYYGSVTAGLDYGLAAPWTVPPGANIGFNINMNKGICDAYLNAGYRFHTSNGGNYTERHNMSGADTLSTLIQNGKNDRRDHGMFLRAGFDLRLGEHSSWGISGFAMVSDKKAFRGHSTTDNTFLLTDHLTGDTLRYYNRDQNNDSWHPGGNVRTDYIFNYGQHNLHISGAFNYFTWNMHNRYTQSELHADTIREWQYNGNADPSVEVKADYEWKPTKNSRLEAGYQMNYAWRSSMSEAGTGHIQHEGTPIYTYFNDFANKEQTHALYVTYGNRFWDKLSLQVGLRGEFFQRNLSSVYYDAVGDKTRAANDTTYFQLFPSAYLSYNFGNGHELQLNYTRRVDRPRGHQINPRMDFSDSTNISYGNPNLLPAYSNNLELNYLKTWERHALSAGVFWKMREGIIQNIKYMDVDVMKNTFINLGSRHELGAEIVAKNRLFGELLQLTTSVNAFYNTITAEQYHTTSSLGDDITISLPKQHVFTWSARLNASFLFTKTFSGQISGNYRSPRVLAQGKTSHSYSIDLGLRKTFLDRKLALAFNVRDILDSRARRSNTYGEGFIQYQQNRWHSRSVSLTLTYNFGTANRQKKPNMQGGDQNNMNSYEDSGFGEE